MEASGKLMVAVLVLVFVWSAFSHLETEWNDRIHEVSYAIDHAGESTGYGHR